MMMIARKEVDERDERLLELEIKLSEIQTTVIKYQADCFQRETSRNALAVEAMEAIINIFQNEQNTANQDAD
jgi:hypothetical protein